MKHTNLSLYFKTKKGKQFKGNIEAFIKDNLFSKHKSKINLIFTSPPFPLNRKKRYGNLNGEEYVEWLKNLAIKFKDLLTDDGSIVIEIGNAWNNKSPTTSTLSIEALLKFKEAGNFFLCQEFIYYNPAKLPTPVQWVNKERIRVKDSFTRLWWLSKSERPKADNRNILNQYSEKMRRLLKTKKYNFGKRPSEHKIGEASFLKDNGGSIPSNVITLSNTISNDSYLKYCKSHDIIPHPARMPEELAIFFINFLTDKKDIVLDPFGGSNTTGSVAEKLDRFWISIEPNEMYLKGSIGRFISKLK